MEQQAAVVSAQPPSALTWWQIKTCGQRLNICYKNKIIKSGHTERAKITWKPKAMYSIRPRNKPQGSQQRLVQAAVWTQSGVGTDQPDHGNKANRKIDLFFKWRGKHGCTRSWINQDVTKVMVYIDRSRCLLTLVQRSRQCVNAAAVCVGGQGLLRGHGRDVVGRRRLGGRARHHVWYKRHTHAQRIPWRLDAFPWWFPSTQDCPLLP